MRAQDVLDFWFTELTPKFSEAVYVLHAFVKKTPKTAAPDLELAHNRYNALLNTRKAGKQS